MIASLGRKARTYGALTLLEIQEQISGPAVWYWGWVGQRIIVMVTLYFFWHAVYGEQQSLSGLGLRETLNYALIAGTIASAYTAGSYVPIFGARLRNGNLVVELMRPVDYQLTFYVTDLGRKLYSQATENLIPWLVGWLFLDLTLPTDPRVWGAFFVTVLLGYSVMHCFDWAFATIAFYVRSYWGIHMMREGLVTFFTGALLPLVMLPDWLQQIALWLPFGQAIYAPVGLLTGIIPLDQAPGVWLIQLAWLAVLLPLSRLAFRTALRNITIQGG